MLKKLIKRIRYLIEAVLVKIGLISFQILGVQRASDYGSKITKFIGSFLPVQKLAKTNISLALPQYSKKEIDNIIINMWDNLGRIVGEFIHICKFDKKELIKYITISQETEDNLKYIKDNHQGGIIFSAHIGNWEVGPKFFLEKGFNVRTVYRPLNNMMVDKMTSQIRGTKLIAKGTKGSKQIIQEVKNGNYVIILADQKISDGTPIPFFHKEAYTTLSIAKLALRYKIPLIPTRIIRIGKEFKFEIEVSKPIEINNNQKATEKEAIDLMLKVNKKLEEWISQNPSQWFWVHDRWKR